MPLPDTAQKLILINILDSPIATLAFICEEHSGCEMETELFLFYYTRNDKCFIYPARGNV